MSYPKTIEDLILSLKMLPGVGEKTAERYALEIIDMEEELVTNFIETIQNVKKKIRKCDQCGNLSEDDLCNICIDESRDHTLICVVENISDLVAMEKTETYQGLYHVLDGLIAPSKGVLPDDLNIESLLTRLEGVKEVIIATNLTIEGETTSLYLIKLLKDKNIEVSRIAHGLPVGGHINYADDLTIAKALEGRRNVE